MSDGNAELIEQPQGGEPKEPFIPAEQPEYQRVSDLMEQHRAVGAKSALEAMAQKPKDQAESMQPEGSQEATTPSRERTPRVKAEKTDNQFKIETSLRNNIQLFTEHPDITTREAGKTMLTERGNIVAENVSALISRESQGQFKDLKSAVSEVKRQLRAERRKLLAPEIKRVRGTFIAGGITPTTEQVASAVDAMNADKTRQIDANLAVLDKVYQQKRTEERRASTQIRQAEVREIALKITPTEIAAFRRNLEKAGKKAPKSDALVKNMLAQKMRTGYSQDPLAIRSLEIDDMMREGVSQQNTASTGTESVATPEAVNQAAIDAEEIRKRNEQYGQEAAGRDGFVHLSPDAQAELDRQQAMSPDERAEYKKGAIAAAEAEALETYKAEANQPEEVIPEAPREMGGFVPGFSDTDASELQKQNRMTSSEREAYKKNAVVMAEDAAFQSNRPEDALESETFAQYKERKANPHIPEGDMVAMQRAQAEIKRMEADNSPMRDDLPKQVRNIIIEQQLSGQEPYATTSTAMEATESTLETDTSSARETVGASIIDFQERSRELSKGRGDKFKGWARKAVAAVIIVGAVIGGAKVGNNNSIAYSTEASAPPSHTLTVDNPSGEPPFTVNLNSEAPGSQQGSAEVKPEIQTVTIEEDQGITQALKIKNGEFNLDDPKEWEDVGQILDRNRGTLESSNQELYKSLDAAREKNPNLSGDEIKALIRAGGENYPVLVFAGQQLQIPVHAAPAN